MPPWCAGRSPRACRRASTFRHTSTLTLPSISMVSRSNSSRLLALLVALSAAPVAGQAPGTSAPLRLSFADAVNMAAGKTPVVELATLRAWEGDGGVRQARAALLPSLSGSGVWLNRSFNSRSIGISFPGVPELIGPFNNYDARLNAAQTLFDWSSVARVRAAGAQADGSRAERGVTVEGSVLTTALAYVRAVRAQSVVAPRAAGGAGARRRGAADRIRDPRGTVAPAGAGRRLRRERRDRAGRHLHPRPHAAGERADSRRLPARGAPRRAGRRGPRVAGAGGRPAPPDRRRGGCRPAGPGLGPSAAGGGARAAAARPQRAPPGPPALQSRGGRQHRRHHRAGGAESRARHRDRRPVRRCRRPDLPGARRRRRPYPSLEDPGLEPGAIFEPTQ